VKECWVRIVVFFACAPRCLPVFILTFFLLLLAACTSLPAQVDTRSGGHLLRWTPAQITACSDHSLLRSQLAQIDFSGKLV